MNPDPITTWRSDAYREGIRAYQDWTVGGPRPENPYWTGSLEGEIWEYEQWQQGWDDAAWDD